MVEGDITVRPSLRIFFAFLLALGASLSFGTRAFADADPLPSWNDGPTKRAILEFVQTTTDESSGKFVPPAERIATFDNDGTLWTEHPMYTQLAFALDRVKALAPQHPEWKDKQPFKAVLDNDLKALAAAGEKGLVELVMASHAGMSTAEFESIVTDWFKTGASSRASSGRIPSWPINRCWSSWGICGPTASRPTSSPAAASSSCGR